MKVFAEAEIFQSAAHFVVIVARRWNHSCGGDGNKAVFTRDSKRLLLLQSHQPTLHKARRWWGNNIGSQPPSEKPINFSGISRYFQSASQLCTFITAPLACPGEGSTAVDSPEHQRVNNKIQVNDRAKMSVKGQKRMVWIQTVSAEYAAALLG